MNVLWAILTNRTLLVAVAAYLIASILKVLVTYGLEQKWDFKRLVGSGGMPSSHSAFVSAMAMSVGAQVGYSSTQFTIAACFAIVVMYDAAGVRRAAGKQAKVLNQIMDEFFHGKPLSQEELKELLGHTPVEVIAGAVLGVIVGLVMPT